MIIFNKVLWGNHNQKATQNRFETLKPDTYDVTVHPRLINVLSNDNFMDNVSFLIQSDLIGIFANTLLYAQEMQTYVDLSMELARQVAQIWYSMRQNSRVNYMVDDYYDTYTIGQEIIQVFLWHYLDIIRPVLLQNLPFSDDDLNVATDEVLSGEKRRTIHNVQDRKNISSSQTHNATNTVATSSSAEKMIGDSYLSPQNQTVTGSDITDLGIDGVVDNTTDATLSATQKSVSGMDDKTISNGDTTNLASGQNLARDENVGFDNDSNSHIIRRKNYNLANFLRQLKDMHDDTLLLKLDNRMQRIFVNKKISRYKNYKDTPRFI